MPGYKKASTIDEVLQEVTVGALEPGDPRYVDTSTGRNMRGLKKLQAILETCDGGKNRFAKLAFTGPRGCGKSTELQLIESRIAHKCFPVHLAVDQTLQHACDLPELLLWTVIEVVEALAEQDVQVSKVLVDGVADWFAAKTLEHDQTMESVVGLETEGNAQTKLSFLGTGFKFLARLKSSLTASSERRENVSRQVRAYTPELLDKINLVLDDARYRLGKAGKPADLLIVQDNLDRLSRDGAIRLFFEAPDLLQQIRAHVVYTVPNALTLAPYSIGKVFQDVLTMPMIAVERRDSRADPEGIKSLTALVGARLQTDRVVASPDALVLLVRASGGSIRDLMRLLSQAALNAKIDGKAAIDGAASAEAVKNLRLDYERTLIADPNSYPRLVQVHRTKAPPTVSPKASADDAQREADYFSMLLFSGAVLEYNGDELWYDVHPVIRDAAPFKAALKPPKPTKKRAPPSGAGGGSRSGNRR
jgi:hypothetical protein